jgi:hypothetical protein
MNVEVKILQKRVRFNTLFGSHIVKSHEVIELANSDTDGFKLLGANEGLFEVYVLDYLAGDGHSDIRSFSDIPPVVTEERCINSITHTLPS